jgi:hypothetical protein
VPREQAPAPGTPLDTELRKRIAATLDSRLPVCGDPDDPPRCGRSLIITAASGPAITAVTKRR